jgi:putative glutamine amidotransferase
LKPLILLTGEDEFDPKSHNPFYLIKRSYGNAVAGAGGTAIMALDPRLFQEYADMADALVLTGGVDVHPGRYRDIFMDFDPNSGLPAPYVNSVTRDSMDILLCQAFIKAGKPILGIGRGMQVINVVFGGTLYQDIPIVLQIPHPVGVDHMVSLTEGSALNKLLGPSAKVNSFHHQAVKEVGNGLKVTAVSEDGVIEALEHESLPVFGVQWHPETFATDDEEVRIRHMSIIPTPVLLPPPVIDPVEVELQAQATMLKKAIPGIQTDADVALPSGNPIFDYFMELVHKGVK